MLSGWNVIAVYAELMTNETRPSSSSGTARVAELRGCVPLGKSASTVCDGPAAVTASGLTSVTLRP